MQLATVESAVRVRHYVPMSKEGQVGKQLSCLTLKY